MEFPSFDECLPEMDQFILELVSEYNAGKIKSWDELEKSVNTFFTPERMDEVEIIVPHWRKMASYANGITLVHVICVFMGLYMLPEFLNMTKEQQQLMKWIILFHDVEKEAQQGKRDHLHAFTSAMTAAQILPARGFTTTGEYRGLIDSWSELISSANIKPEHAVERIQDNHKYPGILSGLEKLFGKDSPATRIIKTILFHMSITVVSDWPQAAPMTAEEIRKYIPRSLIPLLKTMMLADNEGWSLFYPEARFKQRDETLKTFERIEIQFHDFPVRPNG